MHIACEDLNFMWSLQEVNDFREMWKEGLCIVDIAEKLGREVDEVGILVIDQKRQRKIHKRLGGALGDRSIREA